MSSQGDGDDVGEGGCGVSGDVLPHLRFFPEGTTS
jgi:hypothetical protein